MRFIDRIKQKFEKKDKEIDMNNLKSSDIILFKTVLKKVNKLFKDLKKVKENSELREQIIEKILGFSEIFEIGHPETGKEVKEGKDLDDISTNELVTLLEELVNSLEKVIGDA